MDYNITTPGKTTVWLDPTLEVCKVYCPEPADGAINVRSAVTPVMLSWRRGDCTYAQTKDYVYFGTDPNLVCNATGVFLPPPILFLQPAQKLIGNLPLWTTYYWRVDEQVLIGGVPTLVRGDCWSFTTGCEPIVGDANKDCVLNFLDFANLARVWQQSQYWPPQ